MIGIVDESMNGEGKTSALLSERAWGRSAKNEEVYKIKQDEKRRQSEDQIRHDKILKGIGIKQINALANENQD